MPSHLKPDIGKIPPRGVQDSTDSAGKPQTTSDSASESAAVDPELALLIDRWPKLTAHGKATIMGIIRRAKRKAD